MSISTAEKTTPSSSSSMSALLSSSIPKFPRSELEEMMKRWLQANQNAEREGNWSKHLGSFYTNDAIYGWGMGPNEEFIANGKNEICDIALGYYMKGFEEWKYPYHDIIIDEFRGTVICFYKQIAPYTRPCGSTNNRCTSKNNHNKERTKDNDNETKQESSFYEVAGISGSWFEYAGDYKWRWQKDFFDVGNVKSLFMEMAGANVLDYNIKQKIRQQTYQQLIGGNELLPGIHRTRQEADICTKLQNIFALVQIILFGR